MKLKAKDFREASKQTFMVTDHAFSQMIFPPETSYDIGEQGCASKWNPRYVPFHGHRLFSKQRMLWPKPPSASPLTLINTISREQFKQHQILRGTTPRWPGEQIPSAHNPGLCFIPPSLLVQAVSRYVRVRHEPSTVHAAQTLRTGEQVF